MAQVQRAKEKIFANTREMLAMAEAGLADATGKDPRRRRSGLMNLFTYGRSVTFAIQTMKHTDHDFEDWWKPYQGRMQSDPLMKYFNTARTDVLHEGQLSAHTSTVMGARGSVDLGSLMRELNRYAPPNTVATFFGEGSTGGNGWEVRMPDGSTQKVYFDLPATVDVKSELQLPNPPTEHDSQAITDTSIANLGALYLNTLKRIVSEFEARFGAESSQS
jgi:hypothetical protein